MCKLNIVNKAVSQATLLFLEQYTIHIYLVLLTYWFSYIISILHLNETYRRNVTIIKKIVPIEVKF